MQNIALTCGNCVYFKTEKCTFNALFNDKPCSEGILIQLFKSDVLIKKGTTTLLKPIRFLTSNKTKLEIVENFELDSNETEQLILTIKIRTTEKTEPPKKEKPQEPENPELKEKALVLLKEPTIIEKFIEHQDRYLSMDQTVRKLLLLACSSAYGDYPLNIGLMQVFSSGKTTTTIQTAKYFPNAWFLGALSPKALIHEKGEYDEERQGFIIDLQKKILVFLDEPQFETLQMLKPLLSHDKYETEYKYVDKQSGETVKSVLRGFPSVIFCSPKSRYTMEYCSRWFTASPQTNPEKIRKVITAKGKKASEPQQEDIELEIWRKAFEILSQETYKVVIPYATNLSECFRAKKPSDMRYFDLFLALIKATTILHAFQRENTQNHLTATIQDYEIAYSVFHEIETPTTLGLGQNVLDFFQNIIMPIWEERKTMLEQYQIITYDDLLAKYQETYEESTSRSTIRENYLHPLEQKGLIDFEDDPTDKRKRNIIVKDTIPESSLIDNEKFKKRIVSEAR